MSEASSSTETPSGASRPLVTAAAALVTLAILLALAAAQVWAWFHFSTYWFIGLLTVLAPSGMIAANAGMQVMAWSRQSR